MSAPDLSSPGVKDVMAVRPLWEIAAGKRVARARATPPISRLDRVLAWLGLQRTAQRDDQGRQS